MDFELTENDIINEKTVGDLVYRKVKKMHDKLKFISISKMKRICLIDI